MLLLNTFIRQECIERIETNRDTFKCPGFRSLSLILWKLSTTNLLKLPHITHTESSDLWIAIKGIFLWILGWGFESNTSELILWFFHIKDYVVRVTKLEFIAGLSFILFKAKGTSHMKPWAMEEKNESSFTFSTSRCLYNWKKTKLAFKHGVKQINQGSLNYKTH